MDVLADSHYSVCIQSRRRRIKVGDEIALFSDEFEKIMATMKVTEKYTIDKTFECKHIFTTADMEHPGVKMVMEQKDVNLAGTVKVLSRVDSLHSIPVCSYTCRDQEDVRGKGWNTVAALSSEIRCTVPMSTWPRLPSRLRRCAYHQLLGKLKPGDIPAEVRVKRLTSL